jgi:hypothetical protein
VAADVEFFWDPMCPWAWITSRWVTKVAEQRKLDVDWRFICLRLLNEHRDYEKDFPPGYVEGHGSGLKLLRVAAAVRDAEGPERMAALYTQWGGDIHVRRRRKELTEHYEEGFPDYLRSVGIEERYLGAANDESWDEVLRKDRDEALSRTGPDVGTPIISFTRQGQTQSFFGPVISEVPPPERVTALWDAVWELATFPGFAELKRSLRDKPQLATSLD